jgi:hypothetical protein
VLTCIQATLQLLSNSHDLDSSPEIRTIRLLYPESPATTVDVASVLPDGFETLLKQVYRFSHFDLINRCVVVITPEVLHAFDLVSYCLQYDFVCAICRLLLVLLLSYSECQLALPQFKPLTNLSKYTFQ